MRFDSPRSTMSVWPRIPAASALARKATTPANAAIASAIRRISWVDFRLKHLCCNHLFHEMNSGTISVSTVRAHVKIVVKPGVHFGQSPQLAIADVRIGIMVRQVSQKLS